jgi:hypothetical protein
MLFKWSFSSMKKIVLPALAAVISAGGIVFAAGGAEANCAKIHPTQHGEVYLMRGLANIFSLGLDVYGQELSKHGIENCVYNHSYWQSLVNDIVERSYNGELSQPVMIVGHSLGANIAPKMATALAKNNIEVAYVAMLDPVEPTHVGGHVDEIFNYYLPKRNKDNKLYPSGNFDGYLENVNVAKFGGYDHFNIDEKAQLKEIILTRVIEKSSEAGASN